MRVEVRLFGGLSDRVGANRLTVELPDDARVSDLRAAIATAQPSIAAMLPRVNVAVDLEVAGDDRPLAEAREVALLPPVAGGAAARPKVVTGLREPPLGIEEAVAAVTTPEVGATAVFLGSVRDHAPDLPNVERLEYSAYPEMADKVLADVADAIALAHPEVRGIALLHAVGDLAVGDDTILIVCAAPHRAEAFAACRDALERVKAEIPVWKREVTRDGAARWVGLDPEHPDGDQ